MANITDTAGSWNSYTQKSGTHPADKFLLQDSNASGATKQIESEDIESRRVATGNSSLPWAQHVAYWPYAGQVVQTFNDPNNGNVLSLRVGDNPQPPTRQYLDVDDIRFAALPAYTVSGWPGTLTATTNGSIGYSVNNLIAVTGESSSDRNGLYKVVATGDASNPWVLDAFAYWGHPNGYSQYQGGAIYRVRPWTIYATAEFSYRADTTPVHLEYLRGGTPQIVSASGTARPGLTHFITNSVQLTFPNTPAYWEVWRLAETTFVISEGKTLTLKHDHTNATFEGADHVDAKTVYFKGPATVSFQIKPDAGSGAVSYRLIKNTTKVPEWKTIPFFGVSAGHDTSWNTYNWGDKIASIGVGTVRGFADYPDTFAVLQRNNFTVTGILQWFPGSTAHFPTDDIAGWKSYVAGEIAAYPQVTHWEVWNEPPNFAGVSPTPAQYATILDAAYDAAKAVNADVKIGLTAKSNYLYWVDQTLVSLLSTGSQNKFDYITLHPYEVVGYLTQGYEASYLSIVPAIRKLLTARVPAKKDVPVVFTEVAIPAAVAGHNGGISEDAQVDALVKIYSLAAAQGIESVDWFEAWDGDYASGDANSLPFGLISKPSYAARPIYGALAAVIAYLGQKPKYLGWLQLNGPTSQEYGFAFEHNGTTVVVAWTRPGTTQALTFSSAIQVIDPETGPVLTGTSYTLTEHPVFLVAQSGSQITAWRFQLGVNKTKPFPWGGVDRTSNTSVSISAASGANGIWLSNPPTPSTYNGYQVFNKSGSGASWQFTIDPNFLLWTPTSIRIDAVLHRLATNDAYFNASMERTGIAGYSYIGNYSASGQAAGTRTTVTWNVTDAQVYGYFGYHLGWSLDGNPAQSYFALESLTITKV